MSKRSLVALAAASAVLVPAVAVHAAPKPKPLAYQYACNKVPAKCPWLFIVEKTAVKFNAVGPPKSCPAIMAGLADMPIGKLAKSGAFKGSKDVPFTDDAGVDHPVKVVLQGKVVAGKKLSGSVTFTTDSPDCAGQSGKPFNFTLTKVTPIFGG